MTRKRINYYAVAIGSKPGIYKSWSECAMQTQGYSGAIYEGFEFHDDAKAYMKKYCFIPKSKPVEIRVGYIPPYDRHGNPTKKNRYGYHKPYYFRKNGVQHASFGHTIGPGHAELYDPEDTSVPWSG